MDKSIEELYRQELESLEPVPEMEGENESLEEVSEYIESESFEEFSKEEAEEIIEERTLRLVSMAVSVDSKTKLPVELQDKQIQAQIDDDTLPEGYDYLFWGYSSTPYEIEKFLNSKKEMEPAVQKVSDYLRKIYNYFFKIEKEKFENPREYDLEHKFTKEEIRHLTHSRIKNVIKNIKDYDIGMRFKESKKRAEKMIMAPEKYEVFSKVAHEILSAYHLPSNSNYIRFSTNRNGDHSWYITLPESCDGGRIRISDHWSRNNENMNILIEGDTCEVYDSWNYLFYKGGIEKVHDIAIATNPSFFEEDEDVEEENEIEGGTPLKELLSAEQLEKIRKIMG